MKLLVGSGEIELVRNGGECRFRLDNGRERIADVRAAEPGVYTAILEGRSYEARVERTHSGAVVFIDGHRFELEVRDPRRWDRRTGAAGLAGRQTVAAPMPGRVVRVLVRAGDAVEAGQGLLVVEAMKMQNEMRSPKAGRVVSIAAAEGATVAAGEALAIVE
ncbi:MAG: biotin/lipoyl-containing protein [Bryobacteraceae bacterium]